MTKDGPADGMTSESFEMVERLGSRVDVPIEFIVGSASVPRERLREPGRQAIDPSGSTPGAPSSQDVRRSQGEWTVAKHRYVVSRSGWVSERSANYHASGRPVTTQDTAFTPHVPLGLDVLGYTTLDEARAAVEDAEARYEAHSAAAPEVAEAHLDDRLVLGDLLELIEAPS